MESKKSYEIIDGVLHISGCAFPYIDINNLDIVKLNIDDEKLQEFGNIVDQIITFSNKYNSRFIKIQMSNNNLEKLFWDQC